MSGSSSDGLQLVQTDDGVTVRLGRRYLTHPKRPRDAADRRARSFPVRENTLYIVASPLMFYGLHLFQSRLPASSSLTCIEQSDVLAQLSREVRAGEAQNIRFSTSSEPVETARRIVQDLPFSIRRCELVSFGSGLSLGTDHYRQVERTVNRLIAERARNRATLIHFGRKWCRHVFRTMLHSPVPLPGAAIFDAQPVVVVAAGESLEQHIDLLKRYRRQFRLVAVDTALGPLTGHGLLPDLVVAVESQSINTGHFHPRIGRESMLVHDLTCHPDIVRLWPADQKFTFATRFADIRLFDRISTLYDRGSHLPGLGSVGITACALASRLTEGTVVLAGYDFSYIPGKPHARHALSAQLSLIRSGRLEPDILYELAMSRPLFRGNTDDGRPYQSDSVLSSYATYLAQVLPPGRAYTLPRMGPDIDVPVITPEFFADIVTNPSVDALSMSETVERMHRDYGDTEHWISRVQGFIRDELSLLERAQRPDCPDPELELVDYTWVDFPDSSGGRLPESENSRRRILHRLESYTRYIQQCLSSLRP
ncbi:MAG: DUF115 domain-containing protein [Spirochaetaceae bacterium]|nr:MAG: DUF115 domain-containing protein [Spirochaetaceae bacterium]